jgi:mRNA interferase MazF
VKRHEVWTASGGSGYAGKPRPIVIIQADRVQTDSVTFCGFTTSEAVPADYRPLIRASERNGLKNDSCLMVDKIMTVSKSKVGRKIGRLSIGEAAELDRAILFVLGFAD